MIYGMQLCHQVNSPMMSAMRRIRAFHNSLAALINKLRCVIFSVLTQSLPSKSLIGPSLFKLGCGAHWPGGVRHEKKLQSGSLEYSTIRGPRWVCMPAPVRARAVAYWPTGTLIRALEGHRGVRGVPRRVPRRALAHIMRPLYRMPLALYSSLPSPSIHPQPCFRYFPIGVRHVTDKPAFHTPARPYSQPQRFPPLVIF
jgi:hypothetical protein